MIKVYCNNMSGNAPVSEYFTLNECKCHCGECRLTFLSTELLLLMDAFRRAWHLPLKPTSLFRCQKHNRSLPNSSRFSAHMSGEAVDFPLPIIGSEDFTALAESIFPFTYVGEGFVHCALFNR